MVPVLAAIFAGCAVWVAVQQWLTARLKLNYDLFDRRFAVYVATQEFIVFCLNNTDPAVIEPEAFFQARRVAPFLFDKDINLFLDEVGRHGTEVQGVRQERRQAVLAGLRRENGKT